MNYSLQVTKALRKFETGDFDGAEKALEAVGGAASEDLNVLHLIALVFLERNLPKKAAACFDRLSDLYKHNPIPLEILRPMALAYQRSDRISEAALAAEKTISCSNVSADDWLNFGFISLENGDAAKARSAFNHVLNNEIENSDAYFGLGRANIDLKRFEEADLALGKALHFAPDDPEVRFFRAKALCELGNDRQAINLLLEATQIDPTFTEAFCNLGFLLAENGKMEEARREYENATTNDPSCAEAFNGLGTIELSQGKFSRAEKLFRKSIFLNQELVIAHCNLVALKKFETFDEDAKAVENQLKRKEITHDESVQLGFALGKINEDIGEFDNAFIAFSRANKRYRSKLNYSIEKDEAFTRNIINFYNKEKIKSLEFVADSYRKKPVFVIGMPRSGTTLVEQILSSHSLIYGAGELNLFEKLLGRDSQGVDKLKHVDKHELKRIGQKYTSIISSLDENASLIVDKMPTNFLFLGPIALAMPDAKIIHCRRDPLDTCLSCYKRLFSQNHPYSYDLCELGKFYRLYQCLMQHWISVFSGRIVEVFYEDLIENLEAESRRLISACDLAWEDDCLSFYETQRTVFTNPEGVRRPIYNDSVGKWKSYGQHLKPLVQALQQVKIF